MAATVQLGFAQVTQDDKDIVSRPMKGGPIVHHVQFLQWSSLLIEQMHHHLGSLSRKNLLYRLRIQEYMYNSTRYGFQNTFLYLENILL